MKPMNNSFKLLALVACGMASTAQGQQITVYQDSFDGDGLDMNNGTGGGGLAIRIRSTDAFEWSDDSGDGLEAGATTVGNQITTFHSLESFNISEGFTLEVVFDLPSITTSPTPANHLSFGLTPAVPADANDSSVSSEFLSSSNFVPTADAIGFSLGPRNGSVDSGLIEWDADGNGETGLYTALEAITFTEGNDQTLTLEVDSDGNYTYDYNDSIGMGTTTLDLSQTYHFRTRTQGSSGNVIQSITLTTESPQFDAPTIATSASVYDLDDLVDFDITFDPSAETATLVTPTGNVDLLAIDSSDANPGDGQVVFQEAPALDITSYEVIATRMDVADLSAATEILVIDPSNEAPDNAFSTAIKADSPLFYYRFEDLMDSGAEGAPETIFVRDSSGNAFHVGADGLQGGVSVIQGPAGMQNAASFAGNNTGARGILVPATSQLSESYSFVAVLNVIDLTTGNPRHLLSMQSETLGGTTGAQVLQWLSNFRTSLEAPAQSLTEAQVLPSNTSCLIHAVFTADEVDGGGEIAFYINGEAVGTPVTVTTVPNNNGNWILGATDIFQDPSWFNFMDETAIFETALTAEQIAAHSTAFFTAADPFLGFRADTNVIDFGESVELFWKVSDAVTAVTINGSPVDGSAAGGVFSTTFSPNENMTYTIEVTGPDGVISSSTVNVTVIPPIFEPIDPMITSFTQNGTTFVIEFLGNPNTTYELVTSPDLVNGFDGLAILNDDTDDDGVGSFSFPLIETKQFYRIRESE